MIDSSDSCVYSLVGWLNSLHTPFLFESSLPACISLLFSLILLTTAHLHMPADTCLPMPCVCVCSLAPARKHSSLSSLFAPFCLWPSSTCPHTLCIWVWGYRRISPSHPTFHCTCCFLPLEKARHICVPPPTPTTHTPCCARTASSWTAVGLFLHFLETFGWVACLPGWVP